MLVVPLRGVTEKTRANPTVSVNTTARLATNTWEWFLKATP